MATSLAGTFVLLAPLSIRHLHTSNHALPGVSDVLYRITDTSAHFSSPRNENRYILTQECIMATITVFSFRNMVKMDKNMLRNSMLVKPTISEDIGSKLPRSEGGGDTVPN